MRLRHVLVATVVALAACTSPPARPEPSPTPPEAGSSADGPAMSMPRASHTATALPDGRVLVAGGCTTDGCGGSQRAAQAELYVPDRRGFVTGPMMSTPRMGHTATALRDGRVLLVGGWPSERSRPLRTAELFEPGRGAFVPAGVLAVRRGGHTATRLRDGRVLVAGGIDGARALATVELFDPATGEFGAAAPMPGPRATHGAALLSGGRVLVAGGQAGVGHGVALLDTAAVYDPATDAWQQVVGRLAAPMYKLAVAALPDGNALVIGGQTADDAAARLASTALFDVRTGRFRADAVMAEPRYKISDAVVGLADGRIAVGGGFGVEVYTGDQPGDAVAGGRFRQVARSEVERQFPATAALADGTVLVTGGYDNSTRVTTTTLLAGVT